MRLVLNPIIEEKLHAAFPKPANSARKGLAKYVGLLEQLLTDAEVRGRDNFEVIFRLYSIPTTKLSTKGGQIGPKKIRIHKWLAENELSLIQTASTGNNISERVSQVKLTKLVTVADASQPKLDSRAQQLPPITNTRADAKSHFYHLYPELKKTITDQEITDLFEPVAINIKSLKGYMEWLHYSASKIPKATKEQILAQCEKILSVAELTKGHFIQRKNPSEFGRMYYKGLSVQSVNKELRRAMLGNHWEYDIRSSVMAWKLGYALQMIASSLVDGPLEKAFSNTLIYVEDKNDLINIVRHYTYTADSKSDADGQKKSIKRAFTAIGFGATMRKTGWIDSDGRSKNPALVEIFKNKEERERFVNDKSVKKFIDEQKTLDKFIFDHETAKNPELTKLPYLQTASGRPSKAKVLAYLYQHAETEVMDLVREIVSQNGREVLGSIHDAVIVDKRLSSDLRLEIQYQLKLLTGNPYWLLNGEEHEAYDAPSRHIIAQEQAHKLRIWEETRLAEQYAASQQQVHWNASTTCDEHDED
jgi:hypothetical protein